MNYCILNGRKSTTVKGLLIQSLPPITKPLVRNKIETVDGRDGDIITTLGYSAYNKTMTIGLHGDYDVDEVISFFSGENSEGVVTYSNELDKEYNYTIVEQIDFERLVKYKTAEITFHVQPFKYSAVEGQIQLDTNRLKFPEWERLRNGLVAKAKNGVISIIGTASQTTEFYIPIKSLTLPVGAHTLNAPTTGTGESNCIIRLIGEIPSNSDSFNRTFLQLSEDGTAAMSDTLTVPKTFHYIWACIGEGGVNFKLTPTILDNTVNSITITNSGNTAAKPNITVFGAGDIQLLLNGTQVLSLSMGNVGYITINVSQMNAYHDDVLMNRSVVGDYDKLQFPTGRNILSWVGNVRHISIEKQSRWL